MKPYEEEENLERWMISYADLLTLLFAFFVVMYAISSVNKKKYELFAASMHEVFRPKQSKQSYIEEAKKVYNHPFKSIGDKKTPGFNRIDFENVFDNEMMQIRSFNNDWVEIELNSNLIFKSGDAEPNAKAAKKLKAVAKFLKGTPYRIIVEGYTDNIPISTVLFPSNWELSSSRAAAVVRLLTMNGVKSENITPVGFADLYPIADNRTAEGRAKNRRVILVVARDPHVARILNPEAQARTEAKPENHDQQAQEKLSVKREKESVTGNNVNAPQEFPTGVETIRTEGGGLIIRKKSE